MDKTREDLLQTLVQRMMSAMRHVRHVNRSTNRMLSPPHVHLLFSIGNKKDRDIGKSGAEAPALPPERLTQDLWIRSGEKGLVMRRGRPNGPAHREIDLTELAKNQI